MPYSESLAPLTDADRISIRKQLKKIILVLSLMFFVFGGLATTWCVYNHDWFIFLFIALFLLIILFLGVFVVRRASFNIRPDAKKWVIEGEILEKKEKTTVTRQSKGRQDLNTEYFFVFEGREIQINNSSNYRKYNAGDIIHIEVAEDSSIVLSITPITINEPKEIPDGNDYLSGYSESMEDGERRTIRKSLIKRSIIVLIILLAIYFIAVIASAVIIAFYFEKASQPIRHLMAFGRYYFTGAIGILLFMLMIQKLLADFISNLKKVTLCTINDKVHSNVKLLGKNIRTNIQGDYHYILVNKKLFQVSAEDYHKVDAGEKIKIHLGNKSNFFLGVEISK